MQDILEHLSDVQVNAALDEIIKAAESMRIMNARHKPAQRDQARINEYVRTISYYAEALPEQLGKPQS